ncbi:hypothetical protein EJB05_57349, partial [Eragrostis curvula]
MAWPGQQTSVPHREDVQASLSTAPRLPPSMPSSFPLREAPKSTHTLGRFWSPPSPEIEGEDRSKLSPAVLKLSRWPEGEDSVHLPHRRRTPTSTSPTPAQAFPSFLTILDISRSVNLSNRRVTRVPLTLKLNLG